MADPVAELQLNSFEKRRQVLRRQIDAAQKSLERESSSGFGDRSKNAGKYLDNLNKQLQTVDKEEYEAHPLTQAKHAALGVAGVPVGMYAGAKYASHIQMKQDAAISARNKELNVLAREAKKIIPAETPSPKLGKAGKLIKTAPQRKLNTISKQKLGAVVNAADRLGLAKKAPFGLRGLSGPLALPTAALFLGEAAYARFVVGEDQSLSETTREISKSIGTGLATTGVTLVGKRVLHNATTQQLTNAASTAIIEQARKVAGKEAVAAAVAAGAKVTSGASKLVGLAGKAGPVAMGLVALGAGAYSYKQHGSMKRAAAAALDTVAVVTNFEGKVAVQEARQRLGDVKTALSGGGRMQQLRSAYDRAAKKASPAAAPLRRKAKLQRQSSLGQVLVKGHYATSVTGKNYFVRQHMRSLA